MKRLGLLVLACMLTGCTAAEWGAGIGGFLEGAAIGYAVTRPVYVQPVYVAPVYVAPRTCFYGYRSVTCY